MLGTVVAAISLACLTMLLLLYIMHVLQMWFWLLKISSVLRLVRVRALLFDAKLGGDTGSRGVFVAFFMALVFKVEL